MYGVYGPNSANGLMNGKSLEGLGLRSKTMKQINGEMTRIYYKQRVEPLLSPSSFSSSSKAVSASAANPQK